MVIQWLKLHAPNAGGIGSIFVQKLRSYMPQGATKNLKNNLRANIWTYLVAQMVKDLPALWETRVQSLGPKDPWRREWNPLQYFCLENSMNRGAWHVIVHRGRKSQTQLSD